MNECGHIEWNTLLIKLIPIENFSADIIGALKVALIIEAFGFVN
jgi:hypothetical protein